MCRHRNGEIGCNRHRADSLRARPAKIDYLVANHAAIDQAGGKAAMLLWVHTYVAGDTVLFSNGAFRQRYGRERMFNELVGQWEPRAVCVEYCKSTWAGFNARVTDRPAR